MAAADVGYNDLSHGAATLALAGLDGVALLARGYQDRDEEVLCDFVDVTKCITCLVYRDGTSGFVIFFFLFFWCQT